MKTNLMMLIFYEKLKQVIAKSPLFLTNLAHFMAPSSKDFQVEKMIKELKCSGLCCM